MKIARFSDPIFGSSIILTLGTIKEVNEWAKKLKVVGELPTNNYQAFTEKLTYADGTRDYHVHFEAYGFTTIVHETNHLTYNVLSDRGIVFIDETKEVFAYYQDWIAGKCRDYLEKWTKTKRRK